MRINNNPMALNAHNQLTVNQALVAKSMEKLSSGFRINRAGDDAAGLAISEKMRAQIRGLNQASRNAQDGISLIQTAEGALSETHSILQRMRELAAQAANDTNVGVDRSEIQREINQLTSEINRIANTTQFNTRYLLNGDLNLIAGISPKLTGTELDAEFFDIVSEATQAAVVGGELTGSVEILEETGSTATGTKMYTEGADGPNTNLTSATIQGTELSGILKISDGEGNVLTGTEVYNNPTDKGSGPNVKETAATATGASLVGQENLVISDKAGWTLAGTKDLSGGGINVSAAANNELTFKFEGTNYLATIAEANYDAAGFATAVENAMNTAIGGGKDPFSVSYDAHGRIQIHAEYEDEPVPFEITGGGVRDLMLETPATETFGSEMRYINNKLTLDYTEGGVTTQIEIELDNGAYDLSKTAGINQLVTDINAQLVSSRLTGSNTMDTTGLSGLNGSTTATINVGGEDFVMDNAKLEEIFIADFNPAGVAEALGELEATVGGETVKLSDYGDVEVVEGKLQITSKMGSADAVTFTISDGDADTAAIRGAFGIASGDSGGAVYTTVKTSRDVNHKLTFTSTEKGAGIEIGVQAPVAPGVSQLAHNLRLDGYNLETAAGTENTTLEVSFNGGPAVEIKIVEHDYTGDGDNDTAAKFAEAIQTAITADATVFGLTAGQLDEFKVDVDDNGNIRFNTGDAGVTMEIVGGGMKSLLLADPVEDEFAVSTASDVTNILNFSAQGIDISIALDGDDYDLSVDGRIDDLVANIQAKLDEVLPGVIEVSYDDGLKFTNTVEGGESIFSPEITGKAVGVLGLDEAVITQGGEFNKLTITLDGQTETLELEMEDYSAGGKSVNDFIDDVQVKLNETFGDDKITVDLNSQGQIVFTTAEAGEDNISIDGGGAVSLLVNKGETVEDIKYDFSGEVDRSLTLFVGEDEGTIELPAGNYDLSVVEEREELLDNINTQLNDVFGAGVVQASVEEGENGGYSLVFKADSPVTVEAGEGLGDLGLAQADVVDAKEANNTASFKIDGQTISVAIEGKNYTGEELAKAIQDEIRKYGVVNDIESLLDAKVTFEDGKFTVESGKGSVEGILVEGDVAEMMGLMGEGISVTDGVAEKQDDLKLQIGANTGESMAISIGDLSATALKVSGDEAGGAIEIEALNGERFTAHYVEIKNVTNGTNNEDVEYALDVSSYDNATAAISVINDAIEAVSTERSKLGAYQNRLEHTISNLGTSAENMMAAESRIRDLDMAEEMMAFTKNNILQQAAVAMLAQANVLPQIALQLLG